MEEIYLIARKILVCTHVLAGAAWFVKGSVLNNDTAGGFRVADLIGITKFAGLGS
jgi:hypothetical protein